MKLSIPLATLSQGASVDQQTGRLSIFEVIEEIPVVSLPTYIPNAVIALILDKELADQSNIRFEIYHDAPGADSVQVASTPFKLPPDKRRIKLLFRFSGIPIQSLGSHKLRIELIDDNETKLVKSNLGIEVFQTPQVAHGAGGRAPGEKLN